MTDRESTSAGESSQRDQKIPIEVLQAWGAKVLARKGMFATEANMLLQRLTDADLLGESTWGWSRFAGLMQHFDLGDADPRGRTAVERVDHQLVRINAGLTVGPVASTRALLAVVQAWQDQPPEGPLCVDVANTFAGAGPLAMQHLAQQVLPAVAATGWRGWYATWGITSQERPRAQLRAQSLIIAPADIRDDHSLRVQLVERLEDAGMQWQIHRLEHAAGPTTEPVTSGSMLVLASEVIEELRAVAQENRLPLEWNA